MFGSIYGKAVELFGKALLVSAFLPLLAVAAALFFSINPARSVDILTNWTAKETAQQASGALLLLAGLYLLAFIIYGVRDGITRFLSSGGFWILRPLRRWRRIHFTQKEIDKETSYTGEALAVAQAVTWAKGGFGPIDKKFIYIPPNLEARKLERVIDEALGRARKMSQLTSARQREELARLFVALHRLFHLDRTSGSERVTRLHNLCAARDIDLAGWCEDVKALDFGDIVAAYSERVWSPPPRDIQPTELGNILVWAYSYTRKRYGIELDFLYPRLLKVIDKEYQAKIDDRQQFLDFTVILTFLLFVAATAYALAAAASIMVNLEKHAWEPIVGGIAVFAAWLVVGRGVYGLALVAARGYVSIVTSAVDLFRLPLLKQLEITSAGEAAEIAIWSRLNDMILNGEFRPPPEPKPKPEPESRGFLRRLWSTIW